MESEPSSKLPPIYIDKTKKQRTDLLTRQALVPPIFRRREVIKREGKYLRVHGTSNSASDSHPSAADVYRHSLFNKYKTAFNHISTESALNNRFASSQVCGNDDVVLDDGKRSPKKRRREKSMAHEGCESLPNSPWLNRVAPVIVKLISMHDDSLGDPSTPQFQDKLSEVSASGSKLDERSLREMSCVLSKLVSYIDEWHDTSRRLISEQIPIEEARTILEDFKEITGGLIKVDLVTEIEDEIKSCEAFGAKVLNLITTPSTGSVRTVSLEDVHSMLQESRSCKFLVPEVVGLEAIFRNLLSLRNLMETSVLELDVSECESLVSMTEKGIIRLPRLDDLRNRLRESVWLNGANRLSQRPVRFSFAKSLLATVPDVLRNHPLYAFVQKKCANAEKWIQRVSRYSFYRMVMNDNPSGNGAKKDSSTAQDSDMDVDTGIRCDASTFEELCTSYHKLGVTLPLFRNIEPIYQSLRRLQRRLAKIESLLKANSRNPNVANDCIFLLQHSEPLAAYIDISEQLQPLRTDVEQWLSYEKRCRKILDTVKSFSLTVEYNRLKTDWDFLINFRKTTKLSENDFSALTELMKAYDNEDRVSFDEVRQLDTEFTSLRIKNLVLQREMNEIYDRGLSMISKIECAIDSVKEDSGKNASVLSHLVLVIIDVLKFGAKLDSMNRLLQCLDYLRWSRDFYLTLLDQRIPYDGGLQLRTLASIGANETFKEITTCVSVHEKVVARLQELGYIDCNTVVPSTEFDLLCLLLRDYGDPKPLTAAQNVV
ncbi:PLU-1-like family protein [Babesia bovis T2Bo]|uniref:Lysine-specific demethylase-like domain-containing protein n=1 Tax=Babesia bovis TaxID=5865 RepID=A7ARK1_BABBO|nr:PLU-1-like family protein [Babesia bovis T2Bo]EDO07170.1 PLU-1-like family protein [Babesia bovis T2Bo]|eukprot:XP_001610738.1 hypothetical protein [Babesia bovis T2Bo]